MRLVPRSLNYILHPTPTPNLKRAVPAPACHGGGCLDVPLPAATTACSGDACGIKAKAAAPAPTVTITQSITIHVNVTEYQTSWLTAYDTIISTVQHNNTITVTQTATQNVTSKLTEMQTATVTQMLDTKTNSTVPVTAQQQQKGGLNAGDILAIVLGLLLVVMAVGGFFMYRGLSKKRREERVLRKQLQTEGTELKSGDGKDGDGLGGNGVQEWAGGLKG